VRNNLPSGTVTFLFTDVEGSTKLLHELGAEAYAEALAEHRRLIRDVCVAEAGVEVDTQGDAFFFAFPTAPGALAAAETMTESLAPGPIRVRVGLHTGTPLLTEEGYVGDDVHFAARVAATGHGGQVVVSEATAELVEIELSLLGSHRLKDVAEPVSLYQLGDRTFPPLKTIANTNLPAPASTFLGRGEELYEADTLLQETRLLTVTGPGGQGKTRFALELATRAREERFSDYRDGVFSCFFSSLRDPSLVLATIAQTLSVREQPGESALETLSSHLQGKQMLLLLDNLEHLLDAAAELPALLSACPGLTILCTSRELLRVQGERAYDLPPLQEAEGVSLFCERAQSEPSEDVAALCARLEGLPLAIELAAARTRILTPEQLLERLSQRLDLLKAGRDADPRQQTLRATIEWSYELLTPEEQELFARLAVFSGGCKLEAAEEVCEADLDSLQSLVDKSLLRFTDGRYWMLETIRDFAAERLAESGEVGTMRARLGSFLLDLVESAPAARGRGEGQVEIFARLQAEHSNVRDVIEWRFEHGECGFVVRLVSGEWLFLTTRGHAAEADAWLRRALPRAETAPAADRSRGTYAASELARHLGDLQRSEALKQNVLELARGGEPEAEFWRVATLADLSDIALARGDLRAARAFAEEGVATGTHPGQRVRAVSSLASVELVQGNLAEAEALLEEAAQGWEGRHDFNHAFSLYLLGELAWRQGDGSKAKGRYCAALRWFADLGDVGAVTECLDQLAVVAAAEGRFERAGRLFGAARALRDEWSVTSEPIEPPADVPRQALAEGAAMGMEQAVEFALASTE
jgi:predicted ATPase